MSDPSESEDAVPAPSASLPAAVGQSRGDAIEKTAPDEHYAPSSGRRAYRTIRRELTEEELKQSGAPKFLLADLERAEERCDELRPFVDRFYTADKEAAVLKEKANTAAAVDVAFGVGVGLGGAVLGLAPAVWDAKYAGPFALVIGSLLVVGGTIVKAIKR